MSFKKRLAAFMASRCCFFSFFFFLLSLSVGLEQEEELVVEEEDDDDDDAQRFDDVGLRMEVDEERRAFVGDDGTAAAVDRLLLFPVPDPFP